MSDFIREVDEEVRHDQFRRFLDRYWIALVGLVVLILGTVGAFRAYDYYTTQKAQAVGGQYLDALTLSRDGKTAEANAALNKVVQDGTPGYRLLARFRLAADTGRTDPAAGAKLFDDLANDAGLDPALQNLARLRAAVLLVDTTPYPDLKKRLEPLADANNILRNSARELLAVAALKAGQNEEAGRYLDAIETDPITSAPLRQRADAMLGLVRSAGTKPGNPGAEAPPAATAAAPAPAAAPEPAGAPPAPDASPPK
jgi:hypothetical protein